MNNGHEDADISRHKCLIYDGDPAGQLPVVVPMLLDALASNWRCLYLAGPETLPMIDQALTQRGVDTRREQDRGALILTADRSHLAGGRFDPQAMVDMLRMLIDDSVAQGFAGLCATGDMRWELGDDSNFEQLLEYEARLEQLFHEKPLRGICQYRRDVVPAQAVRDALVAHRSAYLGAVLNRDNLFYIPPELLLPGGDSAARQSEWMYQQIVRVVKAEEQRDRALHQLEQRVAERTAELEAFTYAVSHDLRAPLRAISGFSGILAEDFAAALGPEGILHLERVRANAQRMGELIEGMLQLSRVMKADLNRVPVDLTALAEEVARDVREAAPRPSAEFIVHRSLQVLGDPVLLRSMLWNLVGNAWKFTAGRDHTRIEIGRQRDVFFVRDNGAGFDASKAERLFTPFQRFHEQEQFPGTGIGLATVQRIVARHGGRIWAESEPNAGATFSFTLPDSA